LAFVNCQHPVTLNASDINTWLMIYSMIFIAFYVFYPLKLDYHQIGKCQ